MPWFRGSETAECKFGYILFNRQSERKFCIIEIKLLLHNHFILLANYIHILYGHCFSKLTRRRLDKKSIDATNEAILDDYLLYYAKLNSIIIR